MLNRFRRFGFRLLYNELAFTYDLVSRAVSLGHWRSWQRAVLPHLPAPEAGTVLELAHGTGDLQCDLLEAGYRNIALDLSPYMGRLTQRKLKRFDLRTSLIQADTVNLPLKGAAVGAIVCTFPAQFIFHPATLAELNRVLLANGRVIIVLSGILTGEGIRQWLICWLYRLTGQRCQLITDESLSFDFSSSGLDAQTQTVALPGSVVQLLILSKALEPVKSQPQIGLDSLANS